MGTTNNGKEDNPTKEGMLMGTKTYCAYCKNLIDECICGTRDEIGISCLCNNCENYSVFIGDVSSSCPICGKFESMAE